MSHSTRREDLFADLLKQSRAVYETCAALRTFHSWPTDLHFVDQAPVPVPAIRQMALWTAENEFHAAIQAILPFGNWQQTYLETDVGYGFLQDYGYIELYGPTGHFHSSSHRAYLGYWGRGLYYPWHKHEAEEMYCVISGAAYFEAEGEPPVELGPGGIRFHKSWQPHAMTCRRRPVLALILWRGSGLDGRAQMI
jgi:mannose-6-phosphate isomerase-like protein (cupin superfamily)